MKEKDMQRLFGAYLKQNVKELRIRNTYVFELKICKGTSLPFNAVQDHQIEGLLAANSGLGLYHKISDSPIFPGMKTRYTSPKPFDCLYIAQAEAFVVLFFYKPRKPKVAILIPIAVWLYEREISTRKSITEERARLIARHTWVMS